MMQGNLPAVLTPSLQTILFVAPAVALTINALAFVVSARQAWLTNRQTRASLVAGALKEFMSDGDIQEAFYLIEYGRFTYPEAFHGSQTEPKVDKLLRLFSNLALLHQGGLLRTRDVMPLKYYVLRVYRDEAIQRYLTFIKEFAVRAEVADHPYGAFTLLAKEMEKR